ncbi:CGL86 [Auxenochlorella protothecoides x Auxenochlorella symbiontica]
MPAMLRSLPHTSVAPFSRGPLRSRPKATRISAKLTLVPNGDGSKDHLKGEDDVVQPGPISLRSGTLELGRSSNADIRLDIPTVSGKHARIKVESSKILVTDLGSTNGTFVDGKELPANEEREVLPGGEVTFGDVYLAKFSLEESADEASATSTQDTE